jgi:hypothetical protein
MLNTKNALESQKFNNNWGRNSQQILTLNFDGILKKVLNIVNFLIENYTGKKKSYDKYVQKLYQQSQNTSHQDTGNPYVICQITLCD